MFFVESKDEYVGDGSVAKSTGGKRAQPGIAFLRRAVRREILGGELVDKFTDRGDVNRIPAEFVREGNRDGTTIAYRFDTRAEVICCRKIFCGNRLHDVLTGHDRPLGSQA